jgi:hypothetical protein
MANTTNYNWETPDDADLVKDGAAAIRTLGSAIDTTTKNLNPSTTLGDIEYRSSTANTNTRLGIGSTGNVLTVAGGVPTWAAPAAPATGANWSLVNAGGTALTGASTITVSGISSADKIFIIISGASAAAGAWINARLNADSTNGNYKQWGTGLYGTTTWNKANIQGETLSSTQFWMARLSTNGGSVAHGYLSLTGGNAAGLKMIQFSANADNAGGTDTGGNVAGGFYSGTSTISSISLITSDASNFDAGTVFVYTSA